MQRHSHIRFLFYFHFILSFLLDIDNCCHCRKAICAYYFTYSKKVFPVVALQLRGNIFLTVSALHPIPLLQPRKLCFVTCVWLPWVIPQGDECFRWMQPYRRKACLVKIYESCRRDVLVGRGSLLFAFCVGFLSHFISNVADASKKGVPGHPLMLSFPETRKLTTLHFNFFFKQDFSTFQQQQKAKGNAP